jgi:hypothetical protein
MGRAGKILPADTLSLELVISIRRYKQCWRVVIGWLPFSPSPDPAGAAQQMPKLGREDATLRSSYALRNYENKHLRPRAQHRRWPMFDY